MRRNKRKKNHQANTEIRMRRLQSQKKEKDKKKYIRAYKKFLANCGHPKETSIVRVKPSEMDNEILELEEKYGFGTRRDEMGNIIDIKGNVFGPSQTKRIIGRHFME